MPSHVTHMAKSSTGEVTTWLRRLLFPSREPTQERSQPCPNNTNAARHQRAFHASLRPAHSETASSQPPWSPGTPPAPCLPAWHPQTPQPAGLFFLLFPRAVVRKGHQSQLETIRENLHDSGDQGGEIKVSAGPHTVYKNLGKVPFG